MQRTLGFVLILIALAISRPGNLLDRLVRLIDELRRLFGG